MCPDWSGQPQWLFRHDNPSNHIGQQTGAAHQNNKQPNQAYQGDVEVKVLGESGAHTGNLPVRTWTHQPLSRRYRTYSDATISADIRVVLYNLPAIIAIHGLPPDTANFIYAAAIFEVSILLSPIGISQVPVSVLRLRRRRIHGHGRLVFSHRQIALTEQIMHLARSQIGLLQDFR